MTKLAEIFRAPNNDGTGRAGYHVAVREEGEECAYGVYGGFSNLGLAVMCALEHGVERWAITVETVETE